MSNGHLKLKDTFKNALKTVKIEILKIHCVFITEHVLLIVYTKILFGSFKTKIYF